MIFVQSSESFVLLERSHGELITVNADGFVGDRLSWIGVPRLPLLGADVFAATVVAAQGFDSA